MTMISMAFQNNLDLTRRGFLFRTGLSDLLILAFMHPTTRLIDIVQKFEELSMVIRSVFADNNKMSLTRQIFSNPPPFLSYTVMRQKFDPRDDRLQIKED